MILFLRYSLSLLAGTILLSCVDRESGKTAALRLWYEQPAEAWEEALPVGNGRLGAMVFGGIHQERIQLNEESIWTGEMVSREKPGAAQTLP